jgi:hypothetical protein
MTTSQPIFGTKDCTSAKTTNIAMVVRKIARRPTLSANHPPIKAPITAPPCVPAAASPSIAAEGCRDCLMKTRTKPIP